jgi:glutathione synthase/RimK-type ligase-like ATP-grasp enzyme
MTVLIVTHSTDNECVEMVTRALERRGESCFRLDTDLFPGTIDLRVRISGEARSIELQRDGRTVELGALTAAWHRRLAVGRTIPATLERQVRAASIAESRRVLHGLLASLTCFVLDPWGRIRLAEAKQLQLELARGVGLDVPRTLVTNDPDAVRDFWDDCGGRVVAKMMASFAIHEDGQEKVVFTNPLAEQDLAALEGLRLCPMTFQERLEKALELRVTVVGGRIFTAAIDSSAMERSRTDWRREGLALMGSWKAHALPAGVERGLLALMDALGLNYGAADFIVTPEGRHVFLELNPAGEFFWLERENGFPISEALADVLLGRAGRRSPPLLAGDPRLAQSRAPDAS